MGSKLYVGGLPYSATEAQLNDVFAAHGTVESARVIPINSPDNHEALASSKCRRLKKPMRPLQR